MNSVTLIGNIAKYEERTTDTGKNYIFLTLAVRRKFKSEIYDTKTDFINCLAYDKNVITLLNTYTNVGHRLAIRGRLEISTVKEENGSSKSLCFVIIEEIELLPNKEKSNGNSIKENDEDNGTPLPF